MKTKIGINIITKTCIKQNKKFKGSELSKKVFEYSLKNIGNVK